MGNPLDLYDTHLILNLEVNSWGGLLDRGGVPHFRHRSHIVSAKPCPGSQRVVGACGPGVWPGAPSHITLCRGLHGVAPLGGQGEAEGEGRGEREEVASGEPGGPPSRGDGPPPASVESLGILGRGRGAGRRRCGRQWVGVSQPGSSGANWGARFFPTLRLQGRFHSSKNLSGNFSKRASQTTPPATSKGRNMHSKYAMQKNNKKTRKSAKMQKNII